MVTLLGYNDDMCDGTKKTGGRNEPDLQRLSVARGRVLCKSTPTHLSSMFSERSMAKRCWGHQRWYFDSISGVEKGLLSGMFGQDVSETRIGEQSLWAPSAYVINALLQSW